MLSTHLERLNFLRRQEFYFQNPSLFQTRRKRRRCVPRTSRGTPPSRHGPTPSKLIPDESTLVAATSVSQRTLTSMSFLKSRLPCRDRAHRKLATIEASCRAQPSNSLQQLCLSSDGRRLVPPSQMFSQLHDTTPHVTPTSIQSPPRQTFLPSFNFTVFPLSGKRRVMPPIRSLLRRLRNPRRCIHVSDICVSNNSSNSHSNSTSPPRLNVSGRPLLASHRKNLRSRTYRRQASARTPDADNPEDPGG